MTQAREGFSLIELLLAVSLSSLVLLAVLGVATSMIRFHLEGIRKGTVSGGAVLSFVMMSREIESANVLVYPYAGSMNTDLLVVCNNWSRVLPGAGGARLNAAANVDVISYCYNPGAKIIWRYFVSGPALQCPPSPPAIPACDGAAYSNFPAGIAMASKVERLGVARIFSRIASFGGVSLQYAVGEQAPNPTGGRPVPMFIPYRVSLTMQKAYANTAD